MVCAAEYSWATLLAQVLGNKRPLVDCIKIFKEVLRNPEQGLDALLANRNAKEVVTAAVATNWPSLIVRSAKITKEQPDLFKLVRNESVKLIPLLLDHLKSGGIFPAALVKSDFLAYLFDGVVQRNEKLEKIAGYLGESSGSYALDHPSAAKLLGLVNADVKSGAAMEWWSRYIKNVDATVPPPALRKIIVNSAQSQCKGESIKLIVRLLQFSPEISEAKFIDLILNTRFFWSDGDHHQVANLLIERKWRLATKTFRRSWNKDLEMVAWNARDLLSWSDTFLWQQPTLYSTNSRQQHPIKNTRKQVKILFLASNPISSQRLALDEEARLIEDKIRTARYRDFVSLKTCWAIRPSDLQREFLEYEPMIVQFSGHGDGAKGIVLHSQNPKDEKLVDEKALTDLFKLFKDSIKVVVLNACYSEFQAKAIIQEIDFVVGMSDAISDEAARIFASAFYRGLAFGRTVENSFRLGLNELRLMGLEKEEDTPKLLVRSGVDASTTVLMGAK